MMKRNRSVIVKMSNKEVAELKTRAVQLDRSVASHIRVTLRKEMEDAIWNASKRKARVGK